MSCCSEVTCKRGFRLRSTTKLITAAEESACGGVRIACGDEIQNHSSLIEERNEYAIDGSSSSSSSKQAAAAAASSSSSSSSKQQQQQQQQSSSSSSRRRRRWVGSYESYDTCCLTKGPVERGADGLISVLKNFENKAEIQNYPRHLYC